MISSEFESWIGYLNTNLQKRDHSGLFFCKLSSGSNSKRAAAALKDIQLQRLECSVASLLPPRQKTPLCQKLHPPHILSEPLPL
ncbi:hypothetical protein DJ94_4266 [Bacillus pseudomycoides]|nr:hypothetical protein DJ94_4266 [Bacillus pseudomycoides]